MIQGSKLRNSHEYNTINYRLYSNLSCFLLMSIYYFRIQTRISLHLVVFLITGKETVFLVTYGLHIFEENFSSILLNSPQFSLYDIFLLLDEVNRFGERIQQRLRVFLITKCQGLHNIKITYHW